jgi:hypothetical protein
MRAFASPWLAIVGGVLLAVAETARRWGAWPYLPFLLDDYIAGAFLVFGGLRSLRDRRLGQRFLAAAWAFGSGMGYMSFFGHLQGLQQPLPVPHRIGNVAEGPVTVIVGVMLLIALAALVATLRPIESSHTSGT